MHAHFIFNLFFFQPTFLFHTKKNVDNKKITTNEIKSKELERQMGIMFKPRYDVQYLSRILFTSQSIVLVNNKNNIMFIYLIVQSKSGDRFHDLNIIIKSFKYFIEFQCHSIRNIFHAIFLLYRKKNFYLHKSKSIKSCHFDSVVLRYLVCDYLSSSKI